MRYELLIQLVKERQPRSILEVGTWNGQRALEMLKAAPGATYYGFDLFEDGTPEVDEAEKNVKPHHSLESVRKTLQGYDAHLFKGNTRETLAQFDTPVDFVWIDGGHSVETIRSDWENVKRCCTPDTVVVFDDYYYGPIDTDKFGCNRVVETLKHESIPRADWVAGGGWVQMMRVYP